MELNIHGVKTIKVGRAHYFSSSNVAAREMVIIDNKNNKFEITFFGDIDNLAIEHVDSMFPGRD